ncbi:hypothetical protein [Pseudoalteromonas umbrosa]|uniref:hypothetical protein n=1 Tax=Pseudoalteromonas umbrosa TaxID=3048489 RepID=UPI0024C41960|nr:hypothetical protein [Pseudoalteromonas sp. B95]MDK1288487.1 hypothetical protein [Pseudoalteromonas sp. B95]
MTNLFIGNVEPDGYISGDKFYEFPDAKTSLPIAVTEFKLYTAKPVGGTSIRFRLLETMNDGSIRANSEYPDGAWTERDYIPGSGVTHVQIYYGHETDTATGLMFIEAPPRIVTAHGVVSSITVSGNKPAFSSKLEIDVDSNAERVMLFDRLSGELKHNLLMKNNAVASSQDSHSVTVILPLNYSQSQSLTCVVVDDNLEYSGAIMDGVQCEISDLTQR